MRHLDVDLGSSLLSLLELMGKATALQHLGLNGYSLQILPEPIFRVAALQCLDVICCNSFAEPARVHGRADSPATPVLPFL